MAKRTKRQPEKAEVHTHTEMPESMPFPDREKDSGIPEKEELPDTKRDEQELLKTIGMLEAELSFFKQENRHLAQTVGILKEKNEMFASRIEELLVEKEAFYLQKEEEHREIREQVRRLEAENKVVKEKLEKLEQRKELLLEQEEELQKEAVQLKKEREKWNQMLKEFDFASVSDLSHEHKMLQMMNEKLRTRLLAVEKQFQEYKELHAASAEWAVEKELLLEELELLRKDVKQYREAEIQWETVNRLKVDYRYQQEELERLRVAFENAQREKLHLQDEILELKKVLEQMEDARNLSEYYRLRSVNLEREIRRLRRIEEDSAADEMKVFETFTTIIERHPKTENMAERYPGDDQIALRAAHVAKTAQFHFGPELIHGFLAAIRSSRFIILKGLSGTGKTSLPKIMAQTVGGVCETIPVQPSWKSKTDLIGFYNHFNNRFLATPFTEALFKAQLPGNRKRFYFIVLDEMNLARVEYYFSDFNSKLELESEHQVIELFDSFGKTSGELSQYIKDGNKLPIPPNVFFIGTINDDESTYSLSDKIYDRAQVLDFQDVRSGSIGNMERVETQNTLDFFDFLQQQETIQSVNVDKEMEILEEILLVLREKFLMHIGHRPRRHMKVFLQSYKHAGSWDMKEGLDLQIISKLVPKIRFSHSDHFQDSIDALMDVIARKISKHAFSIQALERIKRGL